MDPVVIFVLVLGLLIGFVAEWAYDLAVARKRSQAPLNSELVSSNEKLRADNAKLTHDVASLETLRMQLDLNRSEAEELRTKLARFESGDGAEQVYLADAQRLKSESNELRESLRGRDMELADLRAELGNLKEKLQATTSSNSDELESALATSRREISQLQATIAELRAQSGTDRSSQIEALQSEHAVAMNNSNLELQRLQMQVHQMQQEITESEMTFDRFREVNDNFVDEIEKLRAQLGETDSLRESLAGSQRSAEEHLSNVKRLETLLAQAPSEEQIAAFQSQIEHLTNESRSLRSELDSAPKQEAVQSLEASIRELKQQNESLLEQIRQAPDSSVISDFERKIQALEQELDLAPSPSALAELQAQLRDAESRSMAQKSELEATIQSLAQETHGLRRDLEAAPKQSEVTRLYEDLAQERASKEALQNEISQLPSAQYIEQLVANARDHDQNLEEMRRELESRPRQEALEQLKADMDSLRQELQAKDGAIQQLETRMSRMIDPTFVQGLEEQLTAKNRDILAMQQTIQTLQSKQMAAIPVVTYEPPPATEAPTAAVPTNTLTQRDPFIQVRGIGHIFERKFWEAGIFKFEQLAELTPDQIREIIQPAEWQQIEPEAWISEASRLARRTGT